MIRLRYLRLVRIFPPGLRKLFRALWRSSRMIAFSRRASCQKHSLKLRSSIKLHWLRRRRLYRTCLWLL